MSHQRILLSVLSVGILCGTAVMVQNHTGVLAQAAPDATLQPTEIEQLKLDNKFKDYNILKLEIDEKTAQMAKISTEFGSLVAQIKQAHKWGDEVQVQFGDGKSATFVRIPKPAPQPAAPVKK